MTVFNTLGYMMILCYSTLLPQVTAMVGYDCAGKDMNITSLSLLDTEPCPNYKTSSVSDSIDVQIIQERETYDIHVYLCLVELDYHVTHCGMHSHSSEVANEWGTLIQELTPEECVNMHKNQVANVFGHRITGLKRNSTLVTSLVLSGWSSQDAKCDGGVLNLGNYHWKDVYAVAKARIRLSDHNGLHRISDDQVIMKGGLSCRFSDGFCLDASEGYITWDMIHKESCSRTSYLVLYTGKATKIVVKSTQSSDDAYTLYSIKDGKFLATLTLKGEKTVCGFIVHTNEHPKLLVHELKGNGAYFLQDPLTTSKMDIFLYVNAKFTHVETHMRRELTSLYETLVREQCETKKEVLKTQLALATIDPVEFAYTYMKKPGYTGIVMGEQVHLVKCNPVYVSVRKIDECFNELPVNYSGKAMFMSPRSHIIQKTGTPVACSVLMQPAFKLSDTWFSSNNGLTKTADPSQLSPAMKVKWTYTDAGSLATEGIYTSEDLDKLRNQLMYPSERRAITQTASAVINQDTYISDTSFFNNLITKETVEQSFHTFIRDTWAGFLTFGNLFSGIFGVMLLFKLIKWAFDTIIHSRGLYEVYGCGWQILGAAWDAVTTYLLSPAKVSKYYQSKNNDSNGGQSDSDNEDDNKGNKLYPELEPSAPYNMMTTQDTISNIPPSQPISNRPTDIRALIMKSSMK